MVQLDCVLVELIKLNESVQREKFPLPTTGQIVSELDKPDNNTKFSSRKNHRTNNVH